MTKRTPDTPGDHDISVGGCRWTRVVGEDWIHHCDGSRANGHLSAPVLRLDGLWHLDWECCTESNPHYEFTGPG